MSIMKNVSNKKLSSQQDTHLLVRETPSAKIRERWAQIRLILHERTLERDLLFAHIEECDFDFENVMLFKKMSWWEDVFDKMSVLFCVFSHLPPKYRRGDSFYECPTCHRKYAIPWADMSKIDADTYVMSEATIKPATPTLQAICRNGTRGMA